MKKPRNRLIRRYCKTIVQTATGKLNRIINSLKYDKNNTRDILHRRLRLMLEPELTRLRIISSALNTWPNMLFYDMHAKSFAEDVEQLLQTILMSMSPGQQFVTGSEFDCQKKKED